MKVSLSSTISTAGKTSAASSSVFSTAFSVTESSAVAGSMAGAVVAAPAGSVKLFMRKGEYFIVSPRFGDDAADSAAGSGACKI